MRNWLPRSRMLIFVAPLVLAFTALVAACGGDDKPASTSSGNNSSSSAPAATQPPAVAAAPQSFELHATDQGSGFTFQPAALQVKPGEITIKYTNDSIRNHNLVVKSKDGATELAHSKDLDQGQATEVKFTVTEEGQYQFLCDHTGHGDRGLKSTMTVTRTAS